MKGKKQFYRKAYLRKFPEHGIVKYPSPPAKPDNGNLWLQLAMSVAPMLIMIIVSIIMALQTKSIPTYMFMFIAMIILQPINTISNHRRNKDRYNNEKAAWKEQIKKLNDQYNEDNAQCKRQLENCFRSPDEYFSIASECESILWATLPEHDDYQSARLGIYDAPSFFTPEINGSPAMIDDECKQEWERCERVASESCIENVPFSYNFVKNGVLGICGDVTLAYETIYSIIANLCLRHGYDYLHIALITTKESFNNNYRFIKWMPHIWNIDGTRRMISFNANDLRRVNDDLALFYKESKMSGKKDFFLCIIDDASYFISSELYQSIREKKYGDYLTAIYHGASIQTLPSLCSSVYSLRLKKIKQKSSEGQQPYEAEFFDYQSLSLIESKDSNDNPTNEEKGIIVTPDLISKEDAEKIGRLLAGLELVDGNSRTDIPSKIGFLESSDITSIVAQTIEHNWTNNHSFDNLRALVGIRKGGKAVYVDFADGINMHMIVTGTSGSGKSQFLISLVLSLMLRLSPNDVNFVFMDFKGNAFSSAFAYINEKDSEPQYPPHISGMVTNIENGGARAIARIRKMLQQEIAKRESLLSQATEEGIIHEAKIDLYQREQMAGRIKTAPLPSLVIVIDEFIELIETHKDIMNELSMIARTGRSIGVYLILSAQKIGGKLSPQISANANARICFRVLDVSDSNEIIGSPDASVINPRLFGRGFAKLSGNLIEFQTPWVGARFETEYEEKKIYSVNTYGELEVIDELYSTLCEIHSALKNDSIQKATIASLSSILSQINIDGKDSNVLVAIHDILVELYGLASKYDRELGFTIKDTYDLIEAKLQSTQLKEITRHLVELKLMRAVPVITSSLPQYIRDQDILNEIRLNSTATDYLLPLIPIGKSDNIYSQSHDIAYIDFNRGNWLIRGIESSGKTECIYTIVFNMCVISKSCQFFNIYLCDLKGKALEELTAFKQVSTTFIDNAEKLIRLIYALQRIQIKRAEMFGSGYTSWKHFCEDEERIPAIVVVIDNYDYIAEYYPYIADELQSVMEHGKDTGIFFLISSVGKTAGIMSKLPHIQNKIVFMQPRDTDYSSLLTLNDIKTIERIKGRCFVSDEVTLETQIALVSSKNRHSLITEINRQLTEQVDNDTDFKPSQIETLFEKIQFSWMLRRCKKASEVGRLFLGLDCLSMEPFSICTSDISYLALNGDSTPNRNHFIELIIKLNIELGAFHSDNIIVVSSNKNIKASNCRFFDVSDYKDKKFIDDLLLCIESKVCVIITDDLQRIYEEMKRKDKAGDYYLLRDALQKIYNKELSGIWINSIALSNLAPGTNFYWQAIAKEEFAKLLAETNTANIHIQIGGKNDNLRMTPRSIDRMSVGRLLPSNQAWVRENGQYWRMLCME